MNNEQGTEKGHGVRLWDRFGEVFVSLKTGSKKVRLVILEIDHTERPQGAPRASAAVDAPRSKKWKRAGLVTVALSGLAAAVKFVIPHLDKVAELIKAF